MGLETHTDTPFATFAESTLDALNGLEGYLLMQDTAEGTVALATSGDVVIGVLEQKIKGNPHVRVRLLGKGGTVKVVAGGAIAKGARVIWGSGGKVLTIPASAATYRTLGRKVSQGTSANNDFIEILDVIEPVVVS